MKQKHLSQKSLKLIAQWLSEVLKPGEKRKAKLVKSGNRTLMVVSDL